MDTDSPNQLLIREIQEAVECYDGPPPNEASTCDWVILPLLHAAGYAKKDIVSQASNAGNEYPDYTILPNTSHTWYLEAKDWKKSVDNGPEAVQALNYANAHGQRWVVLTNGREWLLFDNHIQGVEADKRIVARSELRDPSFLDFIVAIGKSSVLEGGINEYAANWRLRAVMRQQLLTRDSTVVKAIARALRQESGLSSVQGADVVRYFSETLDGQVAAASYVPPEQEPPRRADEVDGIYTLKELSDLGDEVSNHKPLHVVTPDGTNRLVSSWRDVASEVVNWVAAVSGLPDLPFRGYKGGKRWFLSLSPVHQNGKEMDSRVLQIAGHPVHMDVNRSAYAFAKCLCALCEVSGNSPGGFGVKLAS